MASPSGLSAKGRSRVLRWLPLAAAVVAVVGLFSGMAAAMSDTEVRAADAAQYGSAPAQYVTCFADLAGPLPRCSYVRPAPPGWTFTVQGADAAELAAAGLSGGRDTVAVADDLVYSQRNGAWPYSDEVRLAEATLRAPWRSASAQGLAISVLARAWSITGSIRYRDAALAAAEAMPLSPEGWPETFPDGSHALAGGLNGVLGLWDAWRVSGDPGIRARFDRAVGWLEANLGRYDREHLVLYALGPHAEPTSADLLRYTIAQLQIVAAVSGRDSLAAKATEWEWRSANPGAFRLNLFLTAFARAPGGVAAIVGALALALWAIRPRQGSGHISRLMKPSQP